MRRIRAAIVMAAILGISWLPSNAAKADSLPPETPVLQSVGTINSHHTVNNHCLFVPYAVSSAASFDLQYLGPDGLLYTATGSGDPASGEVGVCPDDTWPDGFYYLHAIIVYANDPVNATYGSSIYGRHSGLITYEPGDVVMPYTGLKHLTQDDFWLNS